MKIERSKNATRNIAFGTLLKIYQIMIPFMMRTIILYQIGVGYLGLNSLFSSVLQVLNLAELGVSSAMVFSMYKPIAQDDRETVCALMKLYKIYYRVIGSIVLVIGIILIPVIPKLVEGDIPDDVNIYYLYFLNLLATVLTYWLFAYKNSIFQAYQRQDVISKVTIFTDTIKYALQIISLVIFHNYYYYLIATLITQIMSNIVTALLAKKMYPDYNARGTLDKREVKKINQRIKDLFTSKLGGTIVGSADTVVISAFLGLEILAIYQNYFYIVSSVIGFVAIIYSSITAGVGNSMLVKSREENYREFRVFTLLITWVSGYCICCFTTLIQPFMKIWMGKELLLDFELVILLCVYFWVYELVMMISVYKDAAGIWHKDRFRPLISGIVNLILNLVLVQFIHLYGIVISTVISVCLVSLPWIVKNVCSLIFKRGSKEYFINLIKYSLIISIVALCTNVINLWNLDNGIVLLFIKFVLTSIVSNILLVLLLKHDIYFKDAVNLIRRMLHIKN